MKKTRVEKFAEYRAEIENMSFDEDSPVKKEEDERNQQQNTLSRTVQDLMGKYDEYTVLFDNAEIAEKNLLEERRRKKEKERKIKLISVYIILAIVAVSLCVAIILLVVGLL